MREFGLGLIFGGTVAWFAYMINESKKLRDEYNREMTRLFNSVPREQRFGYEDDFPEETRWYLND